MKLVPRLQPQLLLRLQLRLLGLPKLLLSLQRVYPLRNLLLLFVLPLLLQTRLRAPLLRLRLSLFLLPHTAADLAAARLLLGLPAADALPPASSNSVVQLHPRRSPSPDPDEFDSKAWCKNFITNEKPMYNKFYFKLKQHDTSDT